MLLFAFQKAMCIAGATHVMLVRNDAVWLRRPHPNAIVWKARRAPHVAFGWKRGPQTPPALGLGDDVFCVTHKAFATFLNIVRQHNVQDDQTLYALVRELHQRKLGMRISYLWPGAFDWTPDVGGDLLTPYRPSGPGRPRPPLMRMMQTPKDQLPCVCILIPGFIKSYAHLEYLHTLFAHLHARRVYVFGRIFRYMVEPSAHKHLITYNPQRQDYLDPNRLKIFAAFDFVSDDFKPLDKDGYDNRIYSQWHNLKKSFDLYQKHGVRCDVFVRVRSDLRIRDIDRLNRLIHQSFREKKMVFFKSKPPLFVNDMMFIGPYASFSKVMQLSDNIYRYYRLHEFQMRIAAHARNTNNPDYNKGLRCAGESEALLWTHIRRCLDRDRLLFHANDGLYAVSRKA